MLKLPKPAAIAIQATLGVALSAPWAVPALADAASANTATQSQTTPLLHAGDLVRLRSGGPAMTVKSVGGNWAVEKCSLETFSFWTHKRHWPHSPAAKRAVRIWNGYRAAPVTARGDRKAAHCCLISRSWGSAWVSQRAVRDLLAVQRSYTRRCATGGTVHIRERGQSQA
jgi:hypothetical protein